MQKRSNKDNSKSSKLNLLIITILFIIACSAAFAWMYNNNVKNTMAKDNEKNVEEQVKQELAEKIKEDEIRDDNPNDSIDDRVNKIMKNMSLEEKVGQLFIVDFTQLDPNTDGTVFNKTMKDTLKKYPVSGVIYFGNNLVSRDQTTKLNNSLQKNSKIPMFVSVDEEGGDVARIANSGKMKTTKFPNMRSIGDSGDIQKAYEVGNTIGKDIHELGFNVDFAPDSDVITNPDNTEIGNRSFGTNADIVAKMVPEVVRGLHDSNVCSTLKHFPGHGGSKANSHNEFSSTPQTLDGMRNIEFVPFKAGIEADTDFILISHIAAPNVTNDNVPSSLNPKIINNLLREELGYDNIVITDALNMKAVSDYYTPEESCIMALQAGADIFLMTPSLDKSYYAILSACKEGSITEARIDESVRRILRVKIKRGII